MTMAAFLALSSIALPWLGAVAVWLVGNRRLSANRRPEQLSGLQHGLAVFFSVAGAAAALLLLAYTSASPVLRLSTGRLAGDFTLVADGLAVFLVLIANGVGSLAVIFSVDYMAGDRQLGRYYLLVLIFIGAMSGLVLSGNLLFMFLFWELTAFSSYALISFHNDDPKAVAGGIKALIITQFGGVGLLLGAMLAYGYLGSYQISSVLAQGSELPAGILSLMAFGFLGAALAKSAQLPFHTWLPDAMEAPTPVSALIHAATMVNAGIYLLARFYPAFAEVPGWRISIVVVGALTALLAALLACANDDLKRVLAYSTVSQLGYMTFAIGAGGVFASQFHLQSHAIFKALLFLSAGAVIHTVGTRDMREMGGLWRSMPFVATVFVIGSAGLAGLPLFNGFWSKELILESAHVGAPLWALAIMVFVAGLTAYYSARMVWLVFAGEGVNRAVEKAALHRTPLAMRVALAPLALLTLGSWLLAPAFLSWLQATLPYHLLEGPHSLGALSHVLTEPLTYVALLVVALGLLGWWWAMRSARRMPFELPADFGFEHLNIFIKEFMLRISATTQLTQTGQLSWNVVGMGLALAALLLVMVIGG
ncbi:MAG TPA: NADH-quinone oxidoreductase subunit L [Candidatus Sulfomarinibacteraceae bacterium]|nr:NADH-quinone oxidoreductase subunit L [Candidatus Sulfomarinibacteraceae bacterium]